MHLTAKSRAQGSHVMFSICCWLIQCIKVENVQTASLTICHGDGAAAAIDSYAVLDATQWKLKILQLWLSGTCNSCKQSSAEVRTQAIIEAVLSSPGA
jgi:hypothetical protein